MKSSIKVIATALMAVATTQIQAQEIGKFKADLGKKSVMGKDIRIPYTEVTTYYGFIQKGAKPDETRGGKNYYYLYLWIPAVSPEIGIRMVSPVPGDMTPGEKDIVSATYNANKDDKTSYFDTWISLEKAENIVSLDLVKSKGSSAKWNVIDQNDDNSELPAQPSGRKYNSQMRIKSEVGNPLKALTVGLYRIGFTTYKTGDVVGSFVAQIGAPVALPGVKLSNNITDLTK